MTIERSAEELREIFNHFDDDGNGWIDSKEFESLLKSLGIECDEDELKAGIAILDTNKNGRIEFEEFADWWNER